MFSTKRSRKIEEMLSILEGFKKDPRYSEAAEVNAGFVKAARSLPTFLHWLLFSGPKLRQRRDALIEIGDFPVKEWQRQGYEGLITVERHPLGTVANKGFKRELSRILRIMKRAKGGDDPLVVLDLGFGSGDMGRLMAEALDDVPLVYIGVDITPANIALAKILFRPLEDEGKIRFKRLFKVDDAEIDSLAKEAGSSGKVVAIKLGDIFDLDKTISPGKVDIIWHSRVFHHLVTEEKARLEDMCRRLVPLTVELDDRYCFWFFFWTSVASWAMKDNIPFMNDGILSGFRDPAASELKGHFKLIKPFSYARLIFGDSVGYGEAEWQAARDALTQGFSFREP